MIKCNLCHQYFKDGDQVYVFPRSSGEEEGYHMECFCSTSQGRMGYKPERIFTHPELQGFIAQRFNTVY